MPPEARGTGVGFFSQAFAGQHLATTEAIKFLWQAGGITGADQHLLDHLAELRFACGIRPKNPSAAGRKVDHRIAVNLMRPDRPAGARHGRFPGATGEYAKCLVANDRTGQVAELQSQAGSRSDGSEVLASPAADAAREITLGAAAQATGQVAGIDRHRTGGGA